MKTNFKAAKKYYISKFNAAERIINTIKYNSKYSSIIDWNNINISISEIWKLEFPFNISLDSNINLQLDLMYIDNILEYLDTNDWWQKNKEEIEMAFRQQINKIKDSYQTLKLINDKIEQLTIANKLNNNC